MAIKFKWASLLLGIFLLTSCVPIDHQKQEIKPTETVLTTSQIELNPSITPLENTPSQVQFQQQANTPPPMPTKTVDTKPYTSYQLAARLDLASRTLSVKEVIRYINRSDMSLNDLVLVIQANQEEKVFILRNFTWGDGLQINNYQWIGHNLRVILDHPLSAGSSINLDIDYELYLSSKLDFPGYTSRQINLADWYPLIPPYQDGTGWIVHDPADVGENLVYEISDYEVSLVLINAGDNVLVAASAPGKATSSGYTYEARAVRNFSFSVSEEYSLIEKVFGVVDVSVFVFSNQLQAGNAVVDTVGKALEYYGTTFGAYKNKTLTVVESDVPDGMEYDGLFFLGQEYFSAYKGSTKSLLVSLSAHETAHQWWYASVGNDPALEPWLDEALSTYSELLFYENYFPDDVTWWWDYRITQWDPAGPVNSTIYDYKFFRPYVNAVYLRGVLFLNEVNNKVGSKNLLNALNVYAQLYALKIANSSDFFNVLSEDTHYFPSSEKSKYFK